jgi:hypothetical protein
MSDIGSWLQDNWYELGTLLTLMGFLVAGVWFARNFLKTIGTFQGQITALLKLSLAGPANRPRKSPAKDVLAEGISSWLETPAIDLSEPQFKGPNRFALACSRLLAWLEGPIRAASAAPRRVVRWLQAPIGG